MSALTGILARYFGLRFLNAALTVFASIFVLVMLVDYLELMRRAGEIPGVSPLFVFKTSVFRVPQVTERVLPFCVLIGAMSSYLNLSRRLELVVARSSGLSAWQFVAPALIVAFVLGVISTAVYNPISAIMQERAKRYEAELFGQDPMSQRSSGGTFWISQKTDEGQAIINAKTSSGQGAELAGVTIFATDPQGHFKQRIEAATASLMPGAWKLTNARVYTLATMPVDAAETQFRTNLTTEQVRENFATPETVPFWDLLSYIQIAENAGLIAAGYRLQYQKLLARPFLLVAMVLLAAAVSLRFFRFGGVQKMVLSGVAAGFLLYVLQKVTEDLSKAELMQPNVAAWLPVLVGGVLGLIALLYQEDG